MNPFLPILVALFLNQSREIKMNEYGHLKYTSKIKVEKPVIINSVIRRNDYPNGSPIIIDCSDLWVKDTMPKVEYSYWPKAQDNSAIFLFPKQISLLQDGSIYNQLLTQGRAAISRLIVESRPIY